MGLSSFSLSCFVSFFHAVVLDVVMLAKTNKKTKHLSYNCTAEWSKARIGEAKWAGLNDTTNVKSGAHLFLSE